MAKPEHVTELTESWDVTRDDGRVFRIELHRYLNDEPISIVEHKIKIYELAGKIWEMIKVIPKVEQHSYLDIRDQAIKKVLALK